jgi:translin
MIHRSRFSDAEEKLRQAREKLEEIKKISSPHPELAHSGSLNAAYEEYAEAIAFFKFIKERRFLDPKESRIPTTCYLSGLADMIGELRRKALDSLKLGDLETAEKCLGTMEEVYFELVSIENVHSLAPQIRRKTDVARILIESTRGDVTTETRRSLLETSLKTLEEKLRKLGR